VDILKGVNMVYRHELIRGMEIGEGLRSMMCTEPGIAARVSRQGFELHFLRDAWVIHHVAPRLESESRINGASAYALNTTFNYSYTLWRYNHIPLSIVVQIRNLLVGSRRIPGVLRLFFQPSKILLSLKHWEKMLEGMKHGIADRGQNINTLG
jgi:hypothetical protein